MKKIRHGEDHGKLRQTEYPLIGDQLDAIWEQLKNLPPDQRTAKTESMIEWINAVKQKYPKPSK